MCMCVSKYICVCVCKRASLVDTRPMAVFSPLAELIRDNIEGLMLSEQVSSWKAFHEMSLSLVLLRTCRLPWTALTCKCHVPAFVLGILQCCVVVLQDDFSENAVLAMTLPLEQGQRNIQRT